MTPLARRYRVIAPYLVGFKPSEQPDMAYDAKTFVDSLADMFSQLLLDEPVLAGESFGGWVVAQYALQQETRPELPKISKLVIVDGAVRVAPRPPGSPDTASKSINDPAVAALVGQKFGKELSADNSLVRGKVLGGTIFQGALGPEALAKITTPTLLIWGAGDQLIPLSDGQAFAAEIPHAKLVAIPDCGHIPSVERPEAFVKAIREFAG